MLIRYMYRSLEAGTQPRQTCSPKWYIADQDDFMKIFKYDTVVWAAVQNLVTGEYKWWNRSTKHWKNASEFTARFFNGFDRSHDYSAFD